MDYFTQFESLFQEIKRNTGYTKHRVLLEAGVDPAQFRAYKRAGRLLSTDMIKRLGASPIVPLSTNELLAWKALADYGPDVLIEALKGLQTQQLNQRAS